MFSRTKAGPRAVFVDSGRFREWIPSSCQESWRRCVPSRLGPRGAVNLHPVPASNGQQVGASISAETAAVALFSYFLNPTEPLPLPTGESRGMSSSVHRKYTLVYSGHRIPKTWVAGASCSNEVGLW